MKFGILAFAVLKGVWASEDAKGPQALQRDDECLASGEGCALNALQLRSEPEDQESNFTDLDHVNPEDTELLRLFSTVVICCYFHVLCELLRNQDNICKNHGVQQPVRSADEWLGLPGLPLCYSVLPQTEQPLIKRAVTSHFDLRFSH